MHTASTCEDTQSLTALLCLVTVAQLWLGCLCSVEAFNTQASSSCILSDLAGALCHAWNVMSKLGNVCPVPITAYCNGTWNYFPITYLYNLCVLELFKESLPAPGMHLPSWAWPLISKRREAGEFPQGSTKYYNYYSSQKMKQFAW